MTDRIQRLRQESFNAQPSLSIERALIETEFYKENEGKYPIPILRALNFLEICNFIFRTFKKLNFVIVLIKNPYIKSK